jgi:hypothetical protein
VLDHNGIGSASVFGSSSGPVIGLDLAARSSHTVELLVAHEPPVISVLDDADRWFAFFGELGAGEALAARLGVESIEFPGHHMAYLDDADSFASILRQILSNHRG